MLSSCTDTGTPSATTSLDPSAVIATRNVRKINGKFLTLLRQSRNRLQTIEINVEDVQEFLIGMFSSPNSRDGSDTVTTVLESAESLKEIFRALTKYNLWDYLNYYLLQVIIEEFASDDDKLNDMMDQYQRDLTGYVLTLQIQKYLEATHNKYPTTMSDGESSGDEIVPALPQQKKQLFKELSIKFNTNVTDHTLGYVTDLWRSLRNQFKLPRPAMILHSIAEGCICITWLIPVNLVTHVTRMAQETVHMFVKQHIVKVMVEEHCIYFMETELETEHPQLGPDPPILEFEPSPPEIKSSLPETKYLKPPPPVTGRPQPETEPPPPVTDSPLLETEPPPPVTDPIHPLETEPPLMVTEPPLTETKPPQPETEHPPLETELPLPESKPVPLETELPLPESKPTPLETELPLPKTKPPQLENQLPLTETKPSPPEPEPPPLESKMAALIRKVCYIWVFM